jgi:hypothetical protein
MTQAICEREADIARLKDYFAGMPDGEYVAWLRIEAETGVSMAFPGNGRNDARRALRRLKRPYEAIRGDGVKLSAPDNAISIVRGRFVRIDGDVRIADKTQQQLRARHLDQMSADDQRTMIITAGFFGAIRTLVKENSTKILKA